MAEGSDLFSSHLLRIQWRTSVFQGLARERHYTDFDLDDCLSNLEGNPGRREAAVAAFWGAYLANTLPPVLGDLSQDRVRRLLDGSLPAQSSLQQRKDIAFCKLHLAGLLAACLIRPDWPISENPSVATRLEGASEAYRTVEEERTVMEVVDDPSTWGVKHFNDDLFTFSLVLVGGIIRTELSFWQLEQGKYEEAFGGITNAGWNICAATIRSGSDEADSFEPYLPHSGRQFDIQEAADIFEEVKRHSRDVGNWDRIEDGCEAIQHLGYCGLYDSLDDVRDAKGEVFGAEEYWGRSATFAEDQRGVVSSPIPVVTRDQVERVETRHRLERDFLRGLWGEMDVRMQDLLVNAEIEWVHSRQGNMVRDMRQFLELTLPSVFPFLQATIDRQDPRLILTRMRDALSNKKDEGVWPEIDQLRLAIRDKGRIKKELPMFLHKVIDARNYFEKEQHRPGRDVKRQSYVDQATAVRDRLLGIGCEGILPWLLDIKKSSHREFGSSSHTK